MIAVCKQAHRWSQLAWSEGRQPLGAVLHSLDELRELFTVNCWLFCMTTCGCVIVLIGVPYFLLLQTYWNITTSNFSSMKSKPKKYWCWILSTLVRLFLVLYHVSSNSELLCSCLSFFFLFRLSVLLFWVYQLCKFLLHWVFEFLLLILLDSDSQNVHF